jgi:hypothetical protein
MDEPEGCCDCDECGGMSALYAAMYKRPCPDCGHGTPSRMVLTDSPYLANAVLNEARRQPDPDPARAEREGES